MFVRIRKERVPKVGEGGGGDARTTAVKLGVGVEGGFQSDQDKYDVVATYAVVAMVRGADGDGGKARVLAEVPYDEASKNSLPMAVSQSVDSIIHHAGQAVKQDLSAWELDDEPKPVSKYAESLPFVENGVKVSPNPFEWKVGFVFLAYIYTFTWYWYTEYSNHDYLYLHEFSVKSPGTRRTFGSTSAMDSLGEGARTGMGAEAPTAPLTTSRRLVKNTPWLSN